jgi:hypothetical protein
MSSRSTDSVADFGQRLSRLASSGSSRRVASAMPPIAGPVGAGFRTPQGPRATMAALNRARRARKRRRDVFLALCFLALGTLVLGLLPGFRALLSVHVAVDVLLGLYTLALLRRRSAAVAPASASAPRLAGRAHGRPAARHYAAQGSGSYELGAAYALASGE